MLNRKGGVDLPAIINGCPLHYTVRRHADTGAQCVLLLHGWGCDSAVFAPLEGVLRDGMTVASLDFPGHGHSDEPPEPWGVAEYAAQVRAMLLLEKLTPVHIVAHSFGARVALMLAARHPELMGKLVITGGAGIKKPQTEEGKRRTARYKRYSALLAKLRAVPLLGTLAETLLARLRKRYGSPDYVKLNENMRQTFVKVISEDLSPLLPAISAPTLLIWGDADTETPLWMAQAMEKAIPDAGLVVFEGGSHFAFVEQGRRFAVIVKKFLGEGNA